MRGIRVLFVCVLWQTVSLSATDAPHYTISTYAGGAPALPTAAMALAADGRGNVYFVDGVGYSGTPARSNSVFKIDPGGSVTRIAGNSRTGFSGDGGPGASATLNYPVAVATDRVGNVFILDAGNQRVRRVSPDGTISTVAGGGSAVLGDGGPALSGQLNYPRSIAIDSAGNLFIGELGRVRKVTPDGNITTVAGAVRTVLPMAHRQPPFNLCMPSAWQSVPPASFSSLTKTPILMTITSSSAEFRRTVSSPRCLPFRPVVP